MKISDLIKEILDLADITLVESNHPNGGLSLDIQWSDNWLDRSSKEWQVVLTRSSQKQLDAGIIIDHKTVKLGEIECAFHTEGASLLEALRLLFDKVAYAYSWKDG